MNHTYPFIIIWYRPLPITEADSSINSHTELSSKNTASDSVYIVNRLMNRLLTQLVIVDRGQICKLQEMYECEKGRREWETNNYIKYFWIKFGR